MQGHIRKHGKGYQYLFYIKLQDKYKCISKAGFSDKKSATKALRDALSKYENYNYVDNTTIRFSELADEYIEYYAKTNLKLNTYTRYKSFYHKYLETTLGPIKIIDINGMSINRVLNECKYLDPDKPLSGSTLQGIYILINAIFNRALKQELVFKNPCKSADRPKREPVNYSILTYDEINTIIGTLDTTNHFDFLFAAGFIITLETGLRRGELAGLTWDSINLDSNTLRVKNTLLYIQGHTVVQETPKTEHSIRDIYFSDNLKEIFIRLQSIYAKNLAIFGGDFKEFVHKKKIYDFVFRHEDGQHVHPMFFYNKLQRLMKDSKIRKHIRWHDLRHSAASLQLMSGADITTISKRIGHYDPSFTLKVYSHIDMSQQKKVIDNFSTRLPKLNF